MKCYIPQNSGFCSGVSLAVQTAYQNANKSTYMYGEIVHNPIVISELEEKGMKVINSLDDIPDSFCGSVIIRAHGMKEKNICELKNRNIKIIDRTCPKVKKVHDIVRDASNRGLDIILIGDPKHPEVIGTSGWISTKIIVLQSLEEAEKIVPNIIFSEKGVCFVAQTTYNKEKYNEIYEYCSSLIKSVEYNATICEATVNRQDEARQLACIADSFIIIGGRKSSNVSKLYEIVSEYCKNVQFIENADELDVSRLSDVDFLVVLGGASTPQSVILKTVEMIKAYCKINGISFKSNCGIHKV